MPEGEKADRVNRNVAIDLEDWEWLVEEADRNDRTPAAELRRHIKWAIELRKRGQTPEGLQYYHQIMDSVREKIKAELAEEMSEDMDEIRKAIQATQEGAREMPQDIRDEQRPAEGNGSAHSQPNGD